MNNYGLQVLLPVVRNCKQTLHTHAIYMRFYIACIIFCLTSICSSFGQAYKYIGVPEGLSDRRVLSIQKDRKGFMWFLTYTGIDRYDGKDVKHYRLQTEKGYLSFYSERNILETDRNGNVWVIGPEGELFRYNADNDVFKQELLPEEISASTFELIEMTTFDEVWYCNKDLCYVYDLNTRKVKQMKMDHKHKRLTCIFQYDKHTYYIGSEDGICRVILTDDEFILTQCIIPTKIFSLPKRIYVHKTNRLLAYSENSGIIVYDLTRDKTELLYPYAKDFPITKFLPYEENKVLISTRGAGVYQYDLREEKMEQFLHAETNEPNRMNGNNIRDIYMDENKRLWMSVYARGITVYDKALPYYRWYKNHLGNPNSLNDDLVNAILEDSDGDIWFATNNGLTLYSPSKDTWQHVFNRDNTDPESLKNCIFLSLYETRDGQILAGGFMTGIYRIDKESMTVQILTPHSYEQSSRPNNSNKYIRVILQDNEGLVWTGGNYYLGCSDNKKRIFKDYYIGSYVTCLLEKDSTTLLIGTGNGIYVLDKESNTLERKEMPFAPQPINAMFLHKNGDLYIGTTNSGLVVLHSDGQHDIYMYQTSSLLSNTINSIIPKNEKEVVVTTEQNIAMFYAEKKEFYNWTEDQGLIKTNFNPRAGIHTSRGTFIVGTNNGAIEWSDTMKIQRPQNIRILIDRILIDNRLATIHKEIDKQQDSVDVVTLTPDEKALGLHISSINYSNPLYTYYQWKLNGLYDYWRTTDNNNWLQFRNLAPGEYLLEIQCIAKEDYRVLGEKKLKIIVTPSFWQTGWALFAYLFIGIALIVIGIKYSWVRNERKFIRNRVKLFNRTTHYLRTSLSLMKASVNEIQQQEDISDKNRSYLQLINYNAEKLYQTVTNLLNIEKESHEKKIHATRHSLSELIGNYVNIFKPLAEQQGITLHYEDESENAKIWVDIRKIEIIFYNLFTNVIRHAQTSQFVHITSKVEGKYWSVSLHNNKLTQSVKSSVREKAIHLNQQRLKTELSIIKQLVDRHLGKLQSKGAGPSNYFFTVSFPIDHTKYIKYEIVQNEEERSSIFSSVKKLPVVLKGKNEKRDNTSKKYGTILIVESNPDILSFLGNSLSENWDVETAHSQEVALSIVKEQEPDIIISGFNQSGIGKTDLCTLLKSNNETSHIPIILLTTNEDRESIINGFGMLADHYISKPFDMQLLQAILMNIIENRKLLRRQLLQNEALYQSKENQKQTAEENNFLKEVKDKIKIHINDPDFNVDELCSLMGMSRTSLYNKIKALTDQKPSDIIRDIRMHKVCEMLLSGEHSISEVSDIMGFSEPKYFREVFKKYYSMTPGEYIKKMKEK